MIDEIQKLRNTFKKRGLDATINKAIQDKVELLWLNEFYKDMIFHDNLKLKPAEAGKGEKKWKEFI